MQNQSPPKAQYVNRTPTISAIIPAFNEEDSIVETLKSLLRQTKKLRNIIVVDDGSLDATADVVCSIEGVRLIRNTRRIGKAASINRALSIIDSELVMIVDADTMLEDSYVEKSLQVFTKDDVAAASGFVMPNKKSRCRLIKLARAVEDAYSQTTLKKGQNTINGIFVVSGCCAVFRTSVLRSLRFSNDTVTEDLDLTWLIEQNGYKTAIIEAFAYTIEPAGLREYVSQIRRWYSGFFQCLSKYGRRIFQSKPLSFTLTLIVAESLIFTLFWAAAIGMLITFPWLGGEFDSLRWFVLTLLIIDIMIVLFPAIFKAKTSGSLKNFIMGLPIYYSLRIVNAFIWWTTLVEWLFGLKVTWHQSS